MFQKVFLKETWKVQPFRGDTFYGLALPTFQLCVHPLRIFSHSTSKVRKNALLEIAKNLIFLKIKLCILSEQSDSYYKQTHSKINQSFSKWQHQQLFVYIWDYLWHVLCVLRQLNTIECTTSNCWQKSKHQSYFEFAMRYISYICILWCWFFFCLLILYFSYCIIFAICCALLSHCAGQKSEKSV